MRKERWKLTQLIPQLQSTDDCMQWLAKRTLMRNTVTCGVCAQPASLVAYNEGLDGKRWSCRGCNWRQSIRQGSFFSGSHLTLQEIILLMYFWAHDAPQTTMAHETGIERDETIVDWCNFCRDICETWVEENGEEIGGMTDQGEAIVVEIDETKYFRRKYHRGQWREGHWVFGGIERGTGRCFLVEVPNRTAATLTLEIEKRILPGSHIVSDDWASYAQIDRIRGGIYTHSVVVNEDNFVDHDDPDTHTQNVENMWMRAKRKLRRQFGTSRELFPSYLHEFVWRNAMKGRDMFSAFCGCVSDTYVV